ncbi:SRPBCC domain-containing protein [Companilactobacillus halodurans]|uniref:SRPBCC domain-containing protein n=1 Tax=Companilactobacillus halodurans TaxID=2584183 RepID=A0A5P0ZMP8_9LACO|nr:SRPBCC domain-containing protein [Companilactobacillus halodurans]MQS75389.1 SRPBCC domain-containing protein [Companilactobacillus halodurans]MQS97334.1 SRPBCC domain-containing protein [Companilactobacillus halodurans]
MKSINWSTRFLPGKTDNFVSNEVIADKIEINDVWNNLFDTSKWETYYNNATNIKLDDQTDSKLHFGEHFRFDTFGFPIDAQVMELVAPDDGKTARLSWHGWQNGDAKTQFDVYHAFLIEKLADGRIRLLTQESQIGEPAKDLAKQSPNPMLNGHQNWLDGLVKASRK